MTTAAMSPPARCGERLFGIGFAPDGPVFAGQAGQTVGLSGRGVHNEDVRLDHSPFRKLTVQGTDVFLFRFLCIPDSCLGQRFFGAGPVSGEKRSSVLYRAARL